LAESQSVLIIDYGMGNLRSVEKALESVGCRPAISGDPDEILRADKLILPGVGAFGDAMENLRRSSLDKAISEAVRAGKPLLGICLGLQLLFSESEEFGIHKGLGLLPGKVRKFHVPGLQVPHIGWNQIERLQQNPLLAGIPEGSYFYFVNSYYVDPEIPEHILSLTSYGIQFCSIACKDNVWGAQFHPEKSQAMGKRLLRNFLAIS
jgi:imidazole glycerol-phosphate synthase subunit HisH